MNSLGFGALEVRNAESNLWGLACFHSTLQIVFRCGKTSCTEQESPAEHCPGQPGGAGLAASLSLHKPEAGARDAPAPS